MLHFTANSTKRKGFAWMTQLISLCLPQKQLKDFQLVAPLARVSHCGSIEIAYIAAAMAVAPVS